MGNYLTQYSKQTNSFLKAITPANPKQVDKIQFLDVGHLYLDVGHIFLDAGQHFMDFGHLPTSKKR